VVERPDDVLLTAHIHATISPEDLFPRTQGATAEKSITIRP
jgi:hypothetical protein